ncbi:hypothetical protein EYC80_004836 [Monilinia laxa]|uniref:Uncharacterized protein n=1 Tax=Monilinia laxa TaxID=61186 RepID=A0A5N6KJM9_MONLA|nr:hypothetical protein EYC80_004836 [Monilinia laxa]
MSHFWPHPVYAEDQPYSHLILWTHILTRAPPTSAFLTPLLTTSTHTLQTLHLLRPPKPSPNPTPHMLLRTTGTNTVTISAILILATIARMYGREEIEWKDRSWRLLENRGQRECDAWIQNFYLGDFFLILKHLNDIYVPHHYPPSVPDYLMSQPNIAMPNGMLQAIHINPSMPAHPSIHAPPIIIHHHSSPKVQAMPRRPLKEHTESKHMYKLVKECLNTTSGYEEMQRLLVFCKYMRMLEKCMTCADIHSSTIQEHPASLNLQYRFCSRVWN